MRQLTQAESASAQEWLTGIEGFCGYDASGWSRRIWVLHAMYETDALPGGLTHDEVRRIELQAGTARPVVVNGVNLDEIADGVVTGCASGASSDPGDGWRRLLWRDLGDRLGIDPFKLDVPPCHRSFPYRSWPSNITPPAEGSLDFDQFQSVIDCLAANSTHGWDTDCIAYRSPLQTADFKNHTLFHVTLAEVGTLYAPDRGAPNNLWPVDRAWFLYTDADLWATKVSGAAKLIDALELNAMLETVTLAL